MLWVICLCAQWCDVCRQYRPAFEVLSADWPQARFTWVDVEDEESVVGDVEVETFPTLLIGNAQGDVRFFGPLLPQTQVLQRLLKGIQEQKNVPPLMDKQIQVLFQRVIATSLQ